jgi:hypothetical protein
MEMDMAMICYSWPLMYMLNAILSVRSNQMLAHASMEMNFMCCPWKWTLPSWVGDALQPDLWQH